MLHFVLLTQEKCGEKLYLQRFQFLVMFLDLLSQLCKFCIFFLHFVLYFLILKAKML